MSRRISADARNRGRYYQSGFWPCSAGPVLIYNDLDHIKHLINRRKMDEFPIIIIISDIINVNTITVLHLVLGNQQVSGIVFHQKYPG
jgi:hypothetical protein